MRGMSIGGGNIELVIRNTPKQSKNNGEPNDMDFPSTLTSPYHHDNKDQHERTWKNHKEQTAVHTQHRTRPVLEYSHPQSDVNNDFMSSTQVSSADSSGVFIAMGCGIGCLLLLLLIAYAAFRKKNNNRPGTSLRTSVVCPRAVQQHPKIDMRPPEQAGPSPASNDLPPPYSECVNKPVTEDRGPFLTDTELLAHNNHLFGTDFSNKCVAMTTTPNTFGDHKTEFVFDNGRIVERLSVNETENGTRRADGRDNVVYVDEHSKAVL